MKFRVVGSIVLMILLCLFSIGITESEQQFAIQQIDVSAMGEIYATVFDPRMENLQTKDYFVTLDQQKIDVSEVASLDSAGIETDWLFVVDLSEYIAGSRRMTAMAATLNGMIFGGGVKAAVGKNDKVAIIPTGTSIGDIQLTNNEELIKKQIADLKEDKNAKALFGEISTALSYIERERTFKKRYVVVILSTGQNDTSTGATYEKIREQIANANVTVYSFAYLKDTNTLDRKKVDSYNALARASRGGVNFEVETRVTDPSVQVNLAIGNEMRFRCLIMDAAVSEITEGRLSISDAETSRNNDTMRLNDDQKKLIKTAVIAKQEAAATPTPGPTPTPEPLPTDTPEPAAEGIFGLSPVMLGGIAVAVVVLIIIIVAIVKKNKGREADDISPTVDPIQPTAAESLIMADIGKTEPAADVVAPKAVSTILVRLESVGLNEPVVYESPMVDELVIGRVPNVSRLIIKGDPKISSKNSKLTYRNGTMCIEDLSSTNGTRVNGMKVTGQVVLHQQDTIGMGVTNLRISWKKTNG
ncbi:MAG: FHA domain-containing protein [Clostridia bacterium]|nr:FHA domain-containing protein [Clostridia bacterium]